MAHPGPALVRRRSTAGGTGQHKSKGAFPFRIAAGEVEALLWSATGSTAGECARRLSSANGGRVIAKSFGLSPPFPSPSHTNSTAAAAVHSLHAVFGPSRSPFPLSTPFDSGRQSASIECQGGEKNEADHLHCTSHKDLNHLRETQAGSMEEPQVGAEAAAVEAMKAVSGKRHGGGQEGGVGGKSRDVRAFCLIDGGSREVLHACIAITIQKS
ncbi:unnamed protein product [Closterium sp. NIES-64]|nr:unnamed protein product [Closterium sp. NIES-64]